MSVGTEVYKQDAFVARSGEHAENRARWIRHGGMASVGGGLLWLACLANAGMDYGLVPEFRALLLIMNPVLVGLALGLCAFRALENGRSGRFGTVAPWYTFIALVVMLAGNLLEYGIGELIHEDIPNEFEPSDHLGWILFGSGNIAACLGLLTYGLAVVRVNEIRLWVRLTPLVFGGITCLLFAQGLLIIFITAFDEQETILFMSMGVFGVGWIVFGLATRAGIRRDVKAP